MAPTKTQRGKLTIKRKSFECLFCSNIFLHYTSLNSHTNLHTREHPYDCQDCDDNFTDFTYLRRHQKLVHMRQRYHCNLCSASYADNQSLQDHMDRVHHGKKYICKGCSTQYSSHVTLKRHRDGGQCNGINKIICSGKVKGNKDKRLKGVYQPVQKEVKPKLNRKLEKPEKDTGSSGKTKKMKVEICLLNCSKSKKPVTILKKQVNCKPIKLNQISNKPIVKAGASKQQLKSADLSKQLKTCKNRNGSKLLKKSPRKAVVSKVLTKQVQFKCSICPTSYFDRNLLLRHAADLHGRKVFECSICKYLYTDYCNMLRHMKTSHPNDNHVTLNKRDTKCAWCNLTFESYSLLLQHKKERHDLKVFKCSFCPNEYTDYSNMLRHRKTHAKDANIMPHVFTTLAVKSTRKISKVKLSSSSSVPSLKLETFPVIGMMGGLEKTADSSGKNSINDKIFDLINKLENEQKQKDESFFLHLNRYDPSTI